MSPSDSDIIIEFINIGNSVKVTAILASTGLEVSVVGSPKASQAELKSLAIKKLRYVIERDKPKNGNGNGPGILI